MKKLMMICIIFVVWAISSVANAAPTYVLNFDDIYSGNAYMTMPTTYGGLIWENFDVGIEGYAGYYTQSAVSGLYQANGQDSRGRITSEPGNVFNFIGAYFSPADSANLGYVEVTGMYQGVQVGSTARIDFTGATPQWLACDFVGIDELLFSSYDSGNRSYYSFDDFTYSSVVPAPGAVLLGSLGVTLVGWMRRRKSML